MNLHRFLSATVAQLKMTFRRRITLFWSLIFPMILMTLLGLLFGRSISAGTIAVVPVHAAAPQAVVQVLERTHGVTVKTAPTAAKAIEQVRNGDRDAAIVFVPTGGGSYRVRLFTSNTSADQAGIIKGIVLGATDGVSVAATGRSPALVFQPQSVDSASLTYIDFLLPGIVALSIMISAVIGLSTVMVNWRQRGILRRLKLTPIPLTEFFAARVTASLVVAIMQVAVLLLFGRIAFGVHISTTAWAAIPVALAGCLCFLAMGFAIGSIVSDPETGDAVGNVVTNPMMFLSGTFFPVAAMPVYIQQIARVLPLYYMTNGLRDTTVRGLPLSHVMSDIAVLLVMTLGLALVGLRTFRWEPKTKSSRAHSRRRRSSNVPAESAIRQEGERAL
ncbi:MAG TPA: ABC transporter permease [Gaiellales bacterium]|nr:ABC transporter permease [Gaiellales bacterium]